MENGIEVHLCDHASLIEAALLRDDFEALGQRFSFNPSMGFHHTDNGIDAFEAPPSALASE